MTEIASDALTRSSSSLVVSHERLQVRETEKGEELRKAETWVQAEAPRARGNTYERFAG
jgi:hypothetical protein